MRPAPEPRNSSYDRPAIGDGVTCLSAQHFLYLRPLPHGHGSLRPTFLAARTVKPAASASSTSAGSDATMSSIDAASALSSSLTCFAYSFANAAIGFVAAATLGSSIDCAIVASSV